MGSLSQGSLFHIQATKGDRPRVRHKHWPKLSQSLAQAPWTGVDYGGAVHGGGCLLGLQELCTLLLHCHQLPCNQA